MAGIVSIGLLRIMPSYRFRFSIDHRFIDGGKCIELADGQAAVAKAHEIGCALLSRADSKASWAKGVLVVEADDGSMPQIVTMIEVIAGKQTPTRH